MSVVISFFNNEFWFKANWVFRRLCEDIRARYNLSEEEKTELEMAQAVGGLILRSMQPNMRNRMLRMLKQTATNISSDESNQYRGDLDEEGYQLYRSAFPSLLELIEKYENADWPAAESAESFPHEVISSMFVVLSFSTMNSGLRRIERNGNIDPVSRQRCLVQGELGCGAVF